MSSNLNQTTSLGCKDSTKIFSGLYLQIEKSPMALRSVRYLNCGDFEIKVNYSKYQLMYQGALIWEIYSERFITQIEFICIPYTNAVFKAIQHTLDVVLPNRKLIVKGEKEWLISKQ